MKENFDRRHKVIPLPSLQRGDEVWIPEFETSGTVIEETYPRSYRVQTSRGVLWRNRRDLVSLPKEGEPQDEQMTLSHNHKENLTTIFELPGAGVFQNHQIDL